MGYTRKTIEEMNCLDDFFMNAVAEDPEVGDYVSRVKTKPEVKDRIMDFEEYVWLLEKRVEKETAIDCILEFLEEYGEVPETLRQELAQTADIGLLKKYRKLAAKAGSIQEFLKGKETV